MSQYEALKFLMRAGPGEPANERAQAFLDCDHQIRRDFGEVQSISALADGSYVIRYPGIEVRVF